MIWWQQFLTTFSAAGMALVGVLIALKHTSKAERERIQRAQNRADVDAIVDLAQEILEQFDQRLASINSFLLWKQTSDKRYFDRHVEYMSKSMNRDRCETVQITTLCRMYFPGVVDASIEYVNMFESIEKFHDVLHDFDERNNISDINSFVDTGKDLFKKMTSAYVRLIEQLKPYRTSASDPMNQHPSQHKDRAVGQSSAEPHTAVEIDAQGRGVVVKEGGPRTVELQEAAP